MKHFVSSFFLSAVAAIGLTTQPVGAQEAPAEPPEIEPEALAVLKATGDYLGAAEVFAYRSLYGYDVVQDSGIKVEFGSSRHVRVGRPNRLHMESQRRDGLRGVIVFDGESVWAFSPDHNAYATTEQPGDLDESIDFVVSELNMKAPLAEMVSPQFYEHVTANLTRAYHLGETVLAGVDCHHLLMSNDYADFQIWIATGEQPLPRRVIITYREEPGQPQFRASILDWDMSPEDAEGLFSFEPPTGAERVRFYIPAPAEEIEEDAS